MIFLDLRFNKFIRHLFPFLTPMVAYNFSHQHNFFENYKKTVITFLFIMCYIEKHKNYLFNGAIANYGFYLKNTQVWFIFQKRRAISKKLITSLNFT